MADFTYSRGKCNMTVRREDRGVRVMMESGGDISGVLLDSESTTQLAAFITGEESGAGSGVELVVGREYRLLPGSRIVWAGVPGDLARNGVTRVRLASLPDEDGDVEVTALDGRVGYNSCVDPAYLAPLPSTEHKLVVGQEYRLLPGSRIVGRYVPGRLARNGVTRVLLDSLPDEDGDVEVTALDGKLERGEKYGFVDPAYLAPLESS